MKNLVKYCGVLVLCATICVAFPQNNFNEFNFQQNGNQQQNFQQQSFPQQQMQQQPSISTTTTVAPVTTRSPAYIQCIANCPTTSEYNPVCGSDSNNYNNRQKLDCANYCGPRLVPGWTVVTQLRFGTCSAL